MPAVPRFDELFELYSSAVYRTALRVTGDSADAEDVLQNVFLRVVSSGPQIDPLQSPATYFRRAATNAAIDLLRRKKARPDRGASAVDYEDHHASSDDGSPVLKQRLRQALAGIDPEDAELFVLCYLEGFTYEEIAELTGLERGTVGSRLYRIRAALKKELSK